MLNSFQVTGSKLIGGIVLFVDVLKGALAVILAERFFGGAFLPVAVSGVGAVVGHNFPVWLRFQGGRGLATAAGTFAVLNFLCIAFWGLCWAAGYLLFRRVNLGNVLATIGLLIAIVLVPDQVLTTQIGPEVSIPGFKVFGVVLLTVLLTKHIDPVKDYLHERKNLSRIQDKL